MTKLQHLQFLVLMIPTFILLIAAAVSMADLAIPAPLPQAYAMAPDAVWDDRPVQ
jgi:hypothetical protein